MRAEAMRSSESYFAESTRVLAAEYADGLRMALHGIGPRREAKPWIKIKNMLGTLLFCISPDLHYLCNVNHKVRIIMETLEKIFAAKLLKVKAIKLQPTNPFTWASGWKSPFYCDNRKTLSYPGLRSFVKIEIGRLISERFPEADAIAGVATGAIPQGALVADLLALPFVYVRSKPKDHGLENLIEGELRPGMKVVVVEDLISTGGSSLKAVEAIRNNGCEVCGMVAAYTYGFDVATEAFKAANVKLVTLTNYEAVVAEAVRTGYIDAADVDVLNEWRKDPAHWNG